MRVSSWIDNGGAPYNPALRGHREGHSIDGRTSTGNAWCRAIQMNSAIRTGGWPLKLSGQAKAKQHNKGMVRAHALLPVTQ
jgi:hypothetical protein